MLDRRRDYGEVMGDGVAGARWYQDGHYFAPDGTYLFSNPGIAAPKGQTFRSMEDAEAAYQRQQQAQASGVPAKNAAAQKKHTPSAPPPLTEPKTIEPEGMTREQKLMQLNHFQLASLVKGAGGAPITGSGSKAKNISWLLANTSE